MIRLSVTLVATVFLSWTVAQGQTDSIPKNHRPSGKRWHKDDNIGAMLAYHNHIHSALEIGIKQITLSRTIMHGEMPHYHRYAKDWIAVGTGLEFEMSRHFIFAPRLFSSFTYSIFTSSISLYPYTDFKKIDPVITPSIGLCTKGDGGFDLKYGYNFHLTQNSFAEIGQHRLTISIYLWLDSYAVPRNKT
jgi:hypothetical protein